MMIRLKVIRDKNNTDNNYNSRSTSSNNSKSGIL